MRVKVNMFWFGMVNFFAARWFLELPTEAHWKVEDLSIFQDVQVALAGILMLYCFGSSIWYMSKAAWLDGKAIWRDLSAGLKR